MAACYANANGNANDNVNNNDSATPTATATDTDTATATATVTAVPIFEVIEQTVHCLWSYVSIARTVSKLLKYLLFSFSNN